MQQSVSLYLGEALKRPRLLRRPTLPERAQRAPEDRPRDGPQEAPEGSTRRPTRRPREAPPRGPQEGLAREGSKKEEFGLC
eukprot:5574805-Pyramimonas_sp.AAC.1